MQALPKVLLVEDDRSIAGALAQVLRTVYDVDVAPTGKLALYRADSHDYEIVVLDLNLPDMHGLAVCQQLRERGHNMPILIISGDDKVMTKINLLDSGANDYLTKPFSLGELKARLRVLTRDSHSITKPVNKLQVADLILDRRAFQVTRGDINIELRRKEFALLECLMERAGSVVTRDALIRSVWQTSGDIWTNTVDVHIKHLRDKVDRPFDVALIRTAHGLGYKIECPQAITAEKK